MTWSIHLSIFSLSGLYYLFESHKNLWYVWPQMFLCILFSTVDSVCTYTHWCMWSKCSCSHNSKCAHHAHTVMSILLGIKFLRSLIMWSTLIFSFYVIYIFSLRIDINLPATSICLLKCSHNFYLPVLKIHIFGFPGFMSMVLFV